MPRVVPALALTAALAGMTACGSPTSRSDAAGSSSSATNNAAESVAPEQTTDAAPSTAPQNDTAQVIALAVAAGNVSGETDRVDVKLGSEVLIEVTADVSDEVHVHGYDLKVDTIPGQPVTVRFTADIPGVFEVELENSGLLLTRLQVQ